MTTATRLARRLFRRTLTRLDARREHGATAVEYAVMVALISAVMLAAVVALGRSSSSTFETVGTGMKTCGPPAGYLSPHSHGDGTWWAYPPDGGDEVQYTPC